MNENLLKEYIKRVYELETSLYKQKALQQKMEKNIKKCSNVRYEEYYPLYDTENGYPGDDKLGEVICFLLASIFSGVGVVILGVVICMIILACMQGPEGIILVLTFVFMFSIPLYMYFNGKKEWKKEMQEKNAVIEEKNEEIQQRNMMLKKNSETRVMILKKELISLKEMYKQTAETLERYYQEDIIFVKYRNLIAVSSFYEYFISGRCSCLEGHEGAYNIFENEIRQNVIISKLDEVISHLESIEQVQYMLYSAIQESNRETEKISKEVFNMAYNLKKIENSTALIEYNNRITAENTEFLKWYAYFKG